MRAPLPGFARFAWATLVFTLLVIVWGAFVRATGSGAGCGSHWPLCNGEVIPRSPAWETVVEYGHRLTSGLALGLVVGLAWGARRRFRRAHPARRAAALALGFMVSEALIGAGLVLFEYVADDARIARGAWVSLHLVNTFLLVAALAGCAAWASGWSSLRLRGREPLAALLGCALVGVLLVGMGGAVTALGDTLFPASTLEEAEALTFSEGAHLFVRLRIWHPTLAVLVGLLVLAAAGLAAATRPVRSVRPAAAGLLVLYGVEMSIGLANVWWLAPVGLQLLHLVVADLVWIVLVLLSLSALAADPGSEARVGRAA